MSLGFCLQSTLCGILQGGVLRVPKVAINFPKVLLADEMCREPVKLSQGGT